MLFGCMPSKSESGLSVDIMGRWEKMCKDHPAGEIMHYDLKEVNLGTKSVCVCGDNLNTLLDQTCGLEVVNMCVRHPLIQQAQLVFSWKMCVWLNRSTHPTRMGVIQI